MRRLPWNVPFATYSPHDLAVAKLDPDDKAVVVCEPRRLPRDDSSQPERSWRVWFGTVYGYRISNESFFDWTTWNNAVPMDGLISAYIVEGSPWRKDFWNDGDPNLPMTHFVISTANKHFEVLADWAECEELP
jgi:hypothetical protein